MGPLPVLVAVLDNGKGLRADVSVYMKLLCRWYSDQHVTAEELHALGKSSLPYFAQQMNGDPARWLERDRLAR